jgi:hypothetical protein
MRAIELVLFKATRVSVVIAAIVLTLAACTSAAGGATPGVRTPAPTETPSAQPPVTPSAIASAPASTLKDAGAFWTRIGGGENAETFDSLRSMIGASDLVMVGVVTEFRSGRQIAFPETGETMYMAEVRLRVSDTIRGSLRSPNDDPGSVVVETSFGFSPDPSRLSAMEASTPVGSRVVLFLGNKAADAVRHGFPPDAPYAGETYYFLLNGVQAAISDDAGIVAISPGAEDWPWLTGIKGRAFDRVVRDIKATSSATP